MNKRDNMSGTNEITGLQALQERRFELMNKRFDSAQRIHKLRDQIIDRLSLSQFRNIMRKPFTYETISKVTKDVDTLALCKIYMESTIHLDLLTDIYDNLTADVAFLKTKE